MSGTRTIAPAYEHGSKPYPLVTQTVTVCIIPSNFAASNEIFPRQYFINGFWGVYLFLNKMFSYLEATVTFYLAKSNLRTVHAVWDVGASILQINVLGTERNMRSKEFGIDPK